MRLIKGKPIAEQIDAATDKITTALAEAGTKPKLAVVVPTDDEATNWYVRSIVRSAERRGILCAVENMPGASVGRIADCLERLSDDPSVHGIICQTPLPPGVTLSQVGSSISTEKDVDGANPESLGRIVAGLPAFAPATAHAVVTILLQEKVPLSGANVVVLGRSMTVGKPAAILLLDQNATVTVCHSRSRDLPAICRGADVLVTAVGRASLVGADHVGPNATVIDVGTNPTEKGGLVGDVDQAAVEQEAAALTPVPGGVGTVTTALLLSHVAAAAARLSQPVLD